MCGKFEWFFINCIKSFMFFVCFFALQRDLFWITPLILSSIWSIYTALYWLYILLDQCHSSKSLAKMIFSFVLLNYCTSERWTLLLCFVYCWKENDWERIFRISVRGAKIVELFLTGRILFTNFIDAPLLISKLLCLFIRWNLMNYRIDDLSYATVA